MAARRLQALVCCLWLGGCVDASQNPAWTLAGQPGLLLKVQNYYESRGTEEGGRCSAPILEGVSQSRVISDDPSQMVIELTYFYRDWIRDNKCDPQRPLRCRINPECRGFAQRTFFIDKGEDGLSVASMTGGQR
jgi:hypothetical protein